MFVVTLKADISLSLCLPEHEGKKERNYFVIIIPLTWGVHL